MIRSQSAALAQILTAEGSPRSISYPSYTALYSDFTRFAGFTTHHAAS
jgi:hypothetical protein